MAIKTRVVVMYVKKATMSSIKVSYRSIRAHPYIWGVLFFILLLSRAFPLLFSFLVSSSPVIVCTAILLGTLLSYGTPNIPEIEEEDKKTRNISSMQTKSAVDDIFVKKDESFTVETHLETTKEAAAAAAGTSNSARDEIGRDVPVVKMYDNTTLTTSSIIHGEMKQIHSKTEVLEEREVSEREFSVNNQNEVEGLTIETAKIASDSPLDSSLGSPWQPVYNFDASSGSDSDGAESSSPDASMADIMPILNELDPLLKSEHSHATLRSNENSDSSSTGSSQDHELEEVGNKENEIEESQEKDDPNEVAVEWNENDQNNVMDLGYSEIERNRRLENLIARRRLRKLQRYVTEKNLIDLDSLYPTSIPAISASRWNPFDIHYDSDGNLNLPPIPGSAPSVMQPRKNPFDLSYDQAEEFSTISREYLSHHDFMSAVQRDAISQGHESSTVGPSLLDDFSQENEDLKLIDPELHQGSAMLLSKSDEKSLRANSYEESVNLEEKNCDSMQSKPDDEAFVYDRMENVFSSSLPSDVQADFALEALPQGPSEADVSLEDQDLVVVGNVGEDLGLGVVEMAESSGDVPPIADFPESDDEKIMHSSCLPSMVSKSDKSDQSEGDEMIKEPPSIDDSAAYLLPEAHIEHSQISSLDLLSTAEENFEEEDHHKSVLQSPTSSDSTASQVVEETNVHMLDVLAIGPGPEEKIGDALAEPLIIPVCDDMFPGSELAESMEISNVSDMMSKHEMGTIDDIFSKNEGGNLCNPDEEVDGEIHVEVSTLTDFDEGIPLEFDAVGDYRARLLRSVQEGSNQEIGQQDTLVEDPCSESQDSRVLPLKCDGFPIGEDPELTVYNSKLRVLEACSLEELDSVFKQHHEESAVPSTSDLTVDDSVTSESEMVPSELGIAPKKQEITETDTEMVVLEAKSVEDISAALKLEPEVVEGQSSESRERNLEPEHAEVESGEEIKWIL